ncbi:MAG: hypothetical protein JSS38_11075 [Nitrospira sp.]|nr:hypothetical protein [Nitrospira sp.]
MTTDSENEFKPRNRLAILAHQAFTGPSYASRMDRLTSSITLAGAAADRALRKANREAMNLDEDAARDRISDIEEYRGILRDVAIRLTGNPLSHSEIERMQIEIDAMPDTVRAAYRHTTLQDPKPCLST